MNKMEIFEGINKKEQKVDHYWVPFRGGFPEPVGEKDEDNLYVLCLRTDVDVGIEDRYTLATLEYARHRGYYWKRVGGYEISRNNVEAFSKIIPFN